MAVALAGRATRLAPRSIGLRRGQDHSSSSQCRVNLGTAFDARQDGLAFAQRRSGLRAVTPAEQATAASRKGERAS